MSRHRPLPLARSSNRLRISNASSSWPNSGISSAAFSPNPVDLRCSAPITSPAASQARRVPAGNLAASFDPWRNLSAANLAVRQRAFRESVLRGVDLFASREFRLADGKQGTCASCHRPGINHAIDIGTTNLPTAKESRELPLFRITCDASAPPHPQLGRTF